MKSPWPLQSYRLLAFPAALAMTLVWASQFSKSGPATLEIAWFDKAAHFFLFGLMGTLVFRALRLPLEAPPRWMIALGAVLLYGLIDETLQYFNEARSADLVDWIADGLGCLTGVFVYRSWTSYRWLMELPLFGTRPLRERE